MADKDDLPRRGIPFFAVVDGTGVASGGTLTIPQLRNRGMEPICAVDTSGVAASGATLATLHNRGIQFFCPVLETGLAADATTSDALRRKGIQPFCKVTASGVAQGGSATIIQLALKGIGYFCPLDESGTEIPDSPPSGPGAGSPMGLLLSLTYSA